MSNIEPKLMTTYYDGDTGQWIPVPLAEMSERDLTRTALGLEDIAAYDLDDPQWREAHRLAERYKRELRARGIGPTRLTTGERSG